MSLTDDLPPALPAMWRALKRGYEAAPLLLSVAFGLALLAALPDALLAVWFKLLADGVLGGRRGLALAAAAGLGVSTAATGFLRVIGERTQRRFRDQVTIALESHVAWLQASVATIEHHERPVYLDRLAMLRNQIFVLDHMYMSLFTTCGWILRLGVTIALLVSIHPALALLAAFALPTVLTSTWRPGVERAAEERGASANRLAWHLARGVPTPGLAGGLRRLTGSGCRRAGARATGTRHPLRARVLRLPGHGTARARRCGPPSGAGLGGRHRGRERRRQDDAREAAVPAVSADAKAHPRRRRCARAHAGGRLAVPAVGCVSRLLPVRVQGTPYGGCG